MNISRNGNKGNWKFSVSEGKERHPVNYVSWMDAARFCNWLTTGHINIGVYGNRSANIITQNSDLIICLGSRLDTRVTGGNPGSFAKKAKKIVIDIDKYELLKKRGLKIDLKINSDLKIFFNNFKKNKINIIRKNWLDKSINLKKQLCY